MNKETINNIVYLFDRLCAADACYTIQCEDIRKNEKILEQLEISLNGRIDSKNDEQNKIDTANFYVKLIKQQNDRKSKLDNACIQLVNSFTTVVNSLDKDSLEIVLSAIKKHTAINFLKSAKSTRDVKIADQFRYYKTLTKRYGDYMKIIDQRIRELNVDVSPCTVAK